MDRGRKTRTSGSRNDLTESILALKPWTDRSRGHTHIEELVRHIKLRVENREKKPSWPECSIEPDRDRESQRVCALQRKLERFK